MKKALWKLIIRLLPAALAATGMWWRIQMPLESYATLIELSNVGTSAAMTIVDHFSGWNLSAGMLQSAINLVLVDQFNGLMLGIIVSSFFSLLAWVLMLPLRAIGSLLRRNKKKSVKPINA